MTEWLSLSPATRTWGFPHLHPIYQISHLAVGSVRALLVRKGKALGEKVEVFYFSIPSVSSLGNELSTCLIPMVSPFCSNCSPLVFYIIFSFCLSHHWWDFLSCWCYSLYFWILQKNFLLNYFLSCLTPTPFIFYEFIFYLWFHQSVLQPVVSFLYFGGPNICVGLLLVFVLFSAFSSLIGVFLFVLLFDSANLCICIPLTLPSVRTLKSEHMS